MLFGRRKPGFSKEVELKPEEIENEFSDRNDPAMQKEDHNPKPEKTEMVARADAVMAKANMTIAERHAAEAAEKAVAAAAAAVAAGSDDMAQKAAAEGKTVDLFAYMDSLPEVDDPFTPSENPIVELPPEDTTVEEVKDGEILAGYIRQRSEAAMLTSHKALEKEVDNFEEVLAEMKSLESCQDIKTVSGKNDTYYYSEEKMTGNYAMIAGLIEGKDIPATIAHMVRWNCKTYPAPTPFYYFMRHPYNYTKVQVDVAVDQLLKNPDCADIQVVVAFNGEKYLHSTQTMSAKYAKALADDSETTEAGN